MTVCCPTKTRTMSHQWPLGLIWASPSVSAPLTHSSSEVIVDTYGCCMCWPVFFTGVVLWLKGVDLTVWIQPWGWPETWGAVTKGWYLKRGEWKPTVNKKIIASYYYIIPHTHGNIYSAIPARWKSGTAVGCLPTLTPRFPDFWLVQIIVYACKFRDGVNATGQFPFWLWRQCSWIIKNPQKDLLFFFIDWLKCTDVSVHHPATYMCLPPSLLSQSASSWFVSGVFLLFAFCLLWNISAFKRSGDSSCSGHALLRFIQKTGFIFHILISKSSIPPH